MDTRDGRIYTAKDQEEFNRLMKNKFMKPMTIPPTERQMARKPPKVGRNEPCPCGSGKKFKRCCLNVRSSLRKVEVFRDDEWKEVRLTDIRKGERFRMFEDGRPIVHKGKTEWVASTNGFISGKGVGAIEVAEESKSNQVNR